MSASPAPPPPPSPEPTPAAAPAGGEGGHERPRYNFATAVYGLIAVATLMAAENAAGETYGETVAGVVLALVLYWLAHAYSEFVAWRIRRGEGLTRAGLRGTMRQEVPMLAGALPPLVAVLIAWAAGAGLDTGITIALWTAAVTILATELAAGLQAKLTGRDLAIQVFVGTGLGGIILALKLVLH